LERLSTELKNLSVLAFRENINKDNIREDNITLIMNAEIYRIK